MNKPLPSLHHSLILTARTDGRGHEGEVAWSMEFTVFRSENGFKRHAEWVGIFERRGRNAGELLRKVFRKTLALPQELEDPTRLFAGPWKCDGIEYTGNSYSGTIPSSEGELSWNFELEPGHTLDFHPLSRWLDFHTARTQIPVRGSWMLQARNPEAEPFCWSSTEAPARAMIQKRDDSVRIWPTVWFHAQALRDTAASVEHCAEGVHAQPFGKAGPSLTSVSAFERLKGMPDASLWRAVRSNMQRVPQGWSFRTEQDGRELRGRIEVEPKHWISIRHEDVRGSVYYRTSSRMARLEILVLERGKPQGFFSTGLDTWVEWTTRERPIESPELR